MTKRNWMLIIIVGVFIGAVILEVLWCMSIPVETPVSPDDGFHVGDDILLTGDNDRVHTITGIDDRSIVLDGNKNLTVEEFDTYYKGMVG